MLGMDEALELLLAKVCQGCGAQLPAPGLPCDACGTVPPVTKPELEETRSGPGKLAAVEARRLRQQADWHAGQLSALLARADEVEHVAVLTGRREQAQRAFENACKDEQRAATALGTAHEAAVQASARQEEAARAVRQAENRLEAAQRMREGIEAEIDAERHLEAARRVLARYQQPADAAAQAKQQAQQALTAAQAEMTRLEAERDAAVAAVESPGRIPVSEHRVGRDLMRVVLDSSCTPLERAMAAVIVAGLAQLTGVDADIRADARARVLKEIAEAQRHRPLLLPNSDGTMTAITALQPGANPWAPGR